MRIHLVLWTPRSDAGADAKVFRRSGAPNALISYAVIRKAASVVDTRSICANDLMIDSGAYSVATGNEEPISVREYGEWLLANPWHPNYVTMDVIGDADGSWRQTEELWRMGLRPMPVVHLGTPDPGRWLRRYAEHPRVRTIALGGLVTGPRRKIRHFCDFAWSVLMDYWPIRVHGLGVASHRMLDRYPWRSVDSTTWVLGGAMMRAYTRTGVSVNVAELAAKGRLADHEMASAFLRGRKRGQLSYPVKGVNARYFARLERDMTRRWRDRGVSWPGDPMDG